MKSFRLFLFALLLSAGIALGQDTFVVHFNQGGAPVSGTFAVTVNAVSGQPASVVVTGMTLLSGSSGSSVHFANAGFTAGAASTAANPSGVLSIPLSFTFPTAIGTSFNNTRWRLSYTVNGEARQTDLPAQSTTISSSELAKGLTIANSAFDLEPGYPPVDPSGKITVIASPTNAGAAVLKVGTDELPVTLATGPNVVHETATPDDMANGATVEVLQFGSVVGSGTIAKDAFGNFDLTITLSAPAGQGKIHITHTPELTGDVSIWIGPTEVDSYTISSPGMTWDFTVEPFTTFPDGAQVQLKQVVNGDQMVIGSGTIVYGSGPAGGWVVNIGASGKSDVTPEENEVVARLDLIAYNVSGLQIGVRIDGGEIIPVDMLASADAAHGTRKEVIYRADNGLGNLSGKTIEWVVSGTVDGVPVHQNVIASAVIPAGRVVSTDPVVMDNSALVDSSAMVGRQSILPPPDNPFDPEDPEADPEKVSQYQAMRKAFEDAIKSASGGGGGLQSLPSMRGAEKSGTAAGDAISDAVKSISTVGGSAAGPSVGAWTGTNALTVTLPVLGSMTWDPADYGMIPSLLRAIALVWLLWHYFKVCTSILRAANV